ncbi:MAG: DNA cytosine methyltransferase [Pseudomonadota bacterium]
MILVMIAPMLRTQSTYYEFFAGGGMARAGLGQGWSCVFANDYDPAKAASYRANWGGEEFHLGDVADLSVEDLPGTADLAWASFPCQDLSLAGRGGGLKGARSGAFWSFWRLMEKLAAGGRAPRLIGLENVCGTLSSRGGADFVALCEALSAGGYRYGALVVDAACFVPQSRPRLFVVALRRDRAFSAELTAREAPKAWTTTALQEAYGRLPAALRRDWIWWRLPTPTAARPALADLLDPDDQCAWNDAAQTQRLLAMMTPVNRAKVDAARARRARSVGALYKRIRSEPSGARVQRAEVRFDGLAGCLRTPAGGSSRQSLLVVEGDVVRSRLISPRETARLMGLADDYILPDRPNAAYHLTGDGVVAPLVRHLAAALLEPVLSFDRRARRAA